MKRKCIRKKPYQPTANGLRDFVSHERHELPNS